MNRNVSTIPALTLLTLATAALGDAVASPADTSTRLAAWLCGTSTKTDFPLATDATATDLTRGRSIAPTELAGRFPDARVLAVATYDSAPRTLASDLSAQLKQLEDAPAACTRILVVDGPKAKVADDVSAEWVTDVLQLKSGESTGVIVLWYADPTAAAATATASIADAITPDAAAPQPRLVMVLFKTVKSPSGRERITRIAFTLPSDVTR